MQPALHNIGKRNFAVELTVDTREEEGWVEWVKYREGQKFRVITSDTIFFDSDWVAKKDGWSWREADLACDFSGGHLASIETELDQMEFEALEGETLNFAWIGARQEARGKDWLWPDGTKVDFYTEVEAAIPSLDKYPLCIAVFIKRKKWVERSCSYKYPSYVCKIPSKVVTGTQNVSLKYVKRDFDNPSVDEFHVWYLYNTAKQSLLDSWINKRTTGFRLSWGTNTVAKMPLMQNLTPSYQNLTDLRLNMLIEQTAIAKRKGLLNEDIFESAFSEKKRLKAENCSKGYTYYSEEKFMAIQLGFGDNSSYSGNITSVDIENGLIAYALLLFCPNEASKVGHFMEQLVLNSTPRDLLLGVVNSLHSDHLSRNDRDLLNQFFKEVNQVLGLTFGRVLLALSTQAQLEVMLAKDLPYVTDYAIDIQQCLSQNNCTGIKTLIDTLGEYCMSFSCHKNVVRARG